MRAALLWHRWFGILGGLWLFLIALSGSLLVFWEEADRALNPGLLVSAKVELTAAPELRPAVSAAVDIFPGTRVQSVRLPRWPGDPIRVRVVDRADLAVPTGLFGREVFVDPLTGEVLGHRRWGALHLDRVHLMPLIYEFHHSLLAGSTISWLLGLLALCWLLDHLLATPLALRSAKRLGTAFRIRRGVNGHKRHFDWHRAAALWLLPVTAMLAFTGIYFNMSSEFRTVLGWVAPPSERFAASRPKRETALDELAIEADRALSTVRAITDRPISRLFYDSAKGHWSVEVHDPRDLTDEGGEREIIVDAVTGAILNDQHPADGRAGDKIIAWQYPLHSGKAFGWAGRILVFIAGLTTAGLVVTGYLLWFRRMRAKRQAGDRRSVRTGLRALPAE